MNYPEAIKYLESFINYERILRWPYKESLKLERIKDFLATIDNPQDSLRCIHIAGTKGKGSTCAFITYILREAGFKVGLYTSPHLSDFRERIRILEPKTKNQKQKTRNEFEGMISEDEVCNLVERLKPSIEDYNKNSKYGQLSFFEVYTALGFVYFKEKKVDFLILETGLGGRLDATNVVSPLVCGITSISYDHTQKLGNTLKEIATEEAGIIKSRLPNTFYRLPLIVITAPQEEEVIEIIRNRCKDIGAKLYEVGKDIFFEDKGNNGIYQNFNVRGIFDEYLNLKTKLLGNHQVINSATAVGIIEALRFYNLFISKEAIREGLINTSWPGRLEVVSKNPYIVLDGAHNSASAKVLKETIKRFFNYKRLILVLGISKDKDIKGICNELSEISDEIILTKANNRRACEPEIIKSQIQGQRQIFLTKSVEEATNLAKSEAKKEDLILITGSLFVVGEAREILLKRSITCSTL